MLRSSTLTHLISRARFIAGTIGYRSAAGFLRNRDVDFDSAYRMLFNRQPTR